MNRFRASANAGRPGLRDRGGGLRADGGRGWRRVHFRDARRGLTGLPPQAAPLLWPDAFRTMPPPDDDEGPALATFRWARPIPRPDMSWKGALRLGWGRLSERAGPDARCARGQRSRGGVAARGFAGRGGDGRLPSAPAGPDQDLGRGAPGRERAPEGAPRRGIPASAVLVLQRPGGVRTDGLRARSRSSRWSGCARSTRRRRRASRVCPWRGPSRIAMRTSSWRRWSSSVAPWAAIASPLPSRRASPTGSGALGSGWTFSSPRRHAAGARARPRRHALRAGERGVQSFLPHPSPGGALAGHPRRAVLDHRAGRARPVLQRPRTWALSARRSGDTSVTPATPPRREPRPKRNW